MKKGLIILASILVVAFCGLASAEEQAMEAEVWNDPKNISATVWFTTDYMFRGLSNTDENPAIQGSLDYTFKGFYVGIWGSNSELGDAGIEIDYYGGYAGAIDNFGYDLMLIYYTYPEDGRDPEVNYVEAHLGLTYTFADIVLSPTLGVGYNYSPDFYGEDGSAHYVNATLDLALPYDFTLGGEVGYQDVEGDDSTGNNLGMDGKDGYDYWHWRVSLVKDIPKWFTLDLSYHGNDDDAEDFFGDIADSRLVFTVSRTF